MGWYTSAESDDGMAQWALDSPIYVRVQPMILGLSPSLNGGQAMVGEVTREFVHAVTGEEMFMVLFSTVIGHRAVAKKHCTLPEIDGMGPSSLARQIAQRLGPSSPANFGRTQQRLLQQFESAGGDMNGLSQFLVAGDLELLPLTSRSAPSVPTYSPRYGVTFPGTCCYSEEV